MSSLKVEVTNKAQLERYAKKKHKDASIVISITSYGESPVEIEKTDKNNIRGIVKVQFNDVDENDSAGMRADQAIRIADLYKSHNSEIEKIIIQSSNGRGRGAAIAAAFLEYFNRVGWIIFEDYHNYPNMYCYNLMLDTLNSYS